jgi:hypothetical protein
METPSMLAHARLGARLLAGALALTLLPAFALAQDPAPPVNPWKLGYARRMADERFERQENRTRAEIARRMAAKRKLRTGRAGTGSPPARERARPAPPTKAPMNLEPPTPAPQSLRFGGQVLSPPANRIVNDRTADGAGSGQCETSVVGFGDLMVAAWNDGQGFISGGGEQGWGTSVDGGQTWIDHGLAPSTVPGVAGFRWVSDPVLTVNDKTGAFYFSALCDYTINSVARSGVGVIKGRWNGVNFQWGTPVIAIDLPFGQPDKEWVVADSLSGRVYLSYSRFPATGSVIDFQWADSNAAVWSAPRQLSLNTVAERGFVQGSRPVVDGDGRLLVVYELIGSGFSDFYRVCRSLDGGVTFTPPVTAESLYTNFGTGAPGFNRPNAVDFSGISVDRSHGANRGRFYLSWAESINWLDEVFNLGQAGNRTEVEANGTAATATPAVAGQTLRGSVTSFADDDYFAIPLVQGQHFVAAADSVDSGAENLLSLELLATNGVTSLTFTFVDSRANPVPGSPEGFPTGWLFTAPATGTYYLRLTSNLGGSGAYRVRTGLVTRGSERGRDQRDIFVGWSDDGLTWSDPTRLNEDPIGFDDFTPEVAVAPDGGVYCSWYDYHDSTPSKSGGEAGVYLARSGDGGLTWTTLGALTDTLTDWTNARSNIIPNQGDYMSLTATTSQIVTTWSDARRGDPDVFTAQIPIIPNGAQVAFRNLQLGNRRIGMSWLATPADTLTMRLYRSQDDGAYQYLDLVQFDGTGALSYTDTTVVGDHVYAYRLGRFTNGIELFYGQVRVFLPSTFPLSMSSPRPNPITGNSFLASFSLATNEPADLILFDISGREILRQTVNLGVGPHTFTLPVGHGLRQGLYVLTVRQGGHNASARAYLVR